jgi:hypothetical protein
MLRKLTWSLHSEEQDPKSCLRSKDSTPTSTVGETYLNWDCPWHWKQVANQFHSNHHPCCSFYHCCSHQNQSNNSPPSFFIVYSLINMCIHCLGQPYPCPLSPPSPPTPLAYRKDFFCPFLQFCWRVDISNNKKDILFLLVEIRIAIQKNS